MEPGIIEDEQNLYDWGIENRLGKNDFYLSLFWTRKDCFIQFSFLTMYLDISINLWLEGFYCFFFKLNQNDFDFTNGLRTILPS